MRNGTPASRRRAARAWQEEGLRADARALLDRVRSEGLVRTDQVERPRGSRKPGAVADDLERRLLVAATQIHTESGKHARALSTWARFLRERRLRVRDLPPEGRARALLEAPVVGWVGPDRARRLLPWR